jgi:hypothetical protein
MKHLRHVLVAAAATGGLLAAATPAHAQIEERAANDPYSYSYDNYCDFGTTTTDDDLVIITDVDGVQSYKVKTTPSGRLFFQGHFYESATYTNPDTGRSWSSELHAYEHDIKILEVDPATNVATVLTSRHDRFLVYDNHGALVSRDSSLGQFTLHVDLDTLEVEFGDTLKSNGPGNTGEFCTDAYPFTVD